MEDLYQTVPLTNSAYSGSMSVSFAVDRAVAKAAQYYKCELFEDAPFFARFPATSIQYSQLTTALSGTL